MLLNTIRHYALNENKQTKQIDKNNIHTPYGNKLTQTNIYGFTSRKQNKEKTPNNNNSTEILLSCQI